MQQSSTQMTLRQTDTTSAGDNLAFLRSKLVWEVGDDGKERVLDADGNGWVPGESGPPLLGRARFFPLGWLESLICAFNLDAQCHDGLGRTADEGACAVDV
jgi:hypothetical protein